MSKLSMFAVSVLLAIGCGGKKDAVDEVVAGLEDWQKKMCACKDKACADKTHEDYKKWENDVLEPKMKGMDEKKIDKAKMERGDKADEGRKECRRKFDAPEAPPPAAGETPPAGGEAPPPAEPAKP